MMLIRFCGCLHWIEPRFRCRITGFGQAAWRGVGGGGCQRDGFDLEIGFDGFFTIQATCCCVSATSNLLADELVIFAMRSDPKPMCAACHGEAKCAIVEADSDAMKSTICNSLEMQ